MFTHKSHIVKEVLAYIASFGLGTSVPIIYINFFKNKIDQDKIGLLKVNLPIILVGLSATTFTMIILSEIKNQKIKLDLELLKLEYQRLDLISYEKLIR
jgi:hypothetical protein